LTATEDGDPRRDELILRLYQGEMAAQKAAREFEAMRKLRDAGYPVPRVDVLATEPTAFGTPFVIMERITGQSLGQILGQSSGTRRQELLQTFCRLLAELHALDWHPYVPDAVEREDEGPLDRWIPWVQGILHGLGVRDFDAALDWLRERGEKVRAHTLAVVHQDFHPNNILVRADGAPFVIDWTLADVADPRLDLGWTLILMREREGRAMREFILEEYQRQTGTTVMDVEIFEVAATVRRLASIVVSLRLGPASLGMRPGAEAKMNAQRSHLATSSAILREQTGLRIPAVEDLLTPTT
jgi:aminoglycoside phosphotransferase (APT) family kinase protein